MIKDGTTFVDTRIQLHWAAQLLSAAADATLEKADDDSHSNVGWNAATNNMVGRSGCNLCVDDFELEYQNDRLPLIGITLTDAAKWLGGKLGSEIAFRDYEMPQHEVANGEPFSPNLEQLKEIAEWFSFGDKAIAGHGESRIWPHHLDLGFLLPGTSEGTNIGGGFSPGDAHYQQPYFYINPYGVEKPNSLPDVSPGQWTDKWLGTVLTADVITTLKNADEAAAEFVNTSIDHCRQIITGAV